MILVDANAWVHHLRKRDTRLVAFLLAQRVRTCDIVVGELLLEAVLRVREAVVDLFRDAGLQCVHHQERRGDQDAAHQEAGDRDPARLPPLLALETPRKLLLRVVQALDFLWLESPAQIHAAAQNTGVRARSVHQDLVELPIADCRLCIRNGFYARYTEPRAVLLNPFYAFGRDVVRDEVMIRVGAAADADVRQPIRRERADVVGRHQPVRDHQFLDYGLIRFRIGGGRCRPPAGDAREIACAEMIEERREPVDPLHPPARACVLRPAGFGDRLFARIHHVLRRAADRNLEDPVVGPRS